MKMPLEKTHTFVCVEYEKEQDYLREMHKSGWKFVKVTGLGMYYFEKCLPDLIDFPFIFFTNKTDYIVFFHF